MVFSFFKKKSEKMPERQVARPKAQAAVALPEEAALELPAAPLEDLEFTTGNLPPAKVAEKRASG